MNLPKLSVKQPVLIIMAFIAVLIFGIVAYMKLPTDVLPDIELPALTVITVYPGASSNEVEQQVTKVLEQVLSSTENLKTIKSSSKENVSFISLQFNWGVELNEAANNVRDLLELKKRQLPAEAESPFIFKINSAMLPVLIYGVNAGENYKAIDKIIDDEIATPLKRVEGVGTVIVMAQPKREIKINIDPLKLQSYHLSFSQISTLIKAENLSIPAGNVKIGKSDFSVRIPGEFVNLDEVREMVLTNFNGKIIRLCDVAEVEDGFKEKDEIARVKDQYSVIFFVQKKSGANTLQVATATKSKIKELQKTLPPDVKITELIDSSELIVNSINNLNETIYYGLLFVILVVLFFLREWRSSLIIIVTIPFSIIVAFIFMYIAGYSINIFSLMSLVIVIGMVVDDAIVVLENITQHIERGSKPQQAAIYAASEMTRAVSASTFTTIAVFVPMLFLGGLIGILFKQLAVLITVTMLASLITAFSLTPVMASKMLKAHQDKNKKRSWLYVKGENMFRALESGYKKFLAVVLNHKLLSLAVLVLLFGITILAGLKTGTDYIPEFDAGDVTVVFQTETGTSVEETERVTQKVEQIVKDVAGNDLRSYFSAVGQTENGILTTIGFQEGKNISTTMVKLVGPEKRKRSSADVAKEIRKRIARFPEVEKLNVSGGSLLSSAMFGNIKPIQINILSNDFEKLAQVNNQIMTTLMPMKELNNLESTIDKGKLELQVVIDKKKASALGLNVGLIALQIRQNIYGADAGELKENGDEYKMVVRLDEKYRANIDKLNLISLTSLLNQQVSLSSVAKIVQGTGPLEIKHESQQRIVTIQAGLNNTSLGEAATLVQQKISKIDLPEGVEIAYSGQLSEQKESFGNLSLMFVLGIVLVYMVMASQFGSLKDPLIIMTAIPFTVMGVIWAFFAAGLTLSVVTFIGVIMLLGIVVKNGIVLVDYINLLRARNYSITEAVLEGGRSRLRPVLMTTLTALLGMVPMAMSSGMGSEIWSPLGITIIGGLLVSTLITLIIVPVIYLLFHYKALKSA